MGNRLFGERNYRLIKTIIAWIVVLLAVIGAAALIGGFKLLINGEFNQALKEMSVIAIQTVGLMAGCTVLGFVLWNTFKPKKRVEEISHKPGVIQGIPKYEERPSETDLIEEVSNDLGRWSFSDLDNLRKDNLDYKNLEGKILNWQKFWRRHPERNKNLSRTTIKAQEKEAKNKKKADSFPPLSEVKIA